MKKKSFLIIGLLGLAGFGAYFYFKKKGANVPLSLKPGEEPTEETGTQTAETKVAVVTTPGEKINQGIEKATELLTTVKEGIVEIKDKTGVTRAKVRKGKKRTKKLRSRRKRTQTQTQTETPSQLSQITPQGFLKRYQAQ